jgi:hypothetical protein
MTKIYESPDKGDTIYEREAGSSARVLVKENQSVSEQVRELKMWGQIRQMAKTNPAMKEYTDRCIELYHLLRKHK